VPMASGVLSTCVEFTSSDPQKQRLGSMWALSAQRHSAAGYAFVGHL
jgi:hypothetical protein